MQLRYQCSLLSKALWQLIHTSPSLLLYNTQFDVIELLCNHVANKKTCVSFWVLHDFAHSSLNFTEAYISIRALYLRFTTIQWRLTCYALPGPATSPLDLGLSYLRSSRGMNQPTLLQPNLINWTSGDMELHQFVSLDVMVLASNDTQI